MPYLLLTLAILTEVFGTTMLKFANGFTNLWPSVATIVAYVASFWFLSLTLRTMEVGTAYAIWSALGTALIAGIGIVFLNEGASLVRLLGIVVVIAGVVMINLAGAH